MTTESSGISELEIVKPETLSAIEGSPSCSLEAASHAVGEDGLEAMVDGAYSGNKNSDRATTAPKTNRRQLMKQVILAGLLGLGITGYMFAQDHPEHPKSQPDKPTEAKVIAAKVTGENICLGCMLKKERGAAAQCSKYGHRHALRVTEATEAGKDLPEMKGWVLHYLDTDNGQPFIKEHHSETLTLEGQVYTQERVLEVKKQTAASKPEQPEHPKRSEHPEHPNN